MQRILSAPRLAKAASGLTAAEFEAPSEVFGALWEKPLRRRTTAGAVRQRQPGGGCKGQLSGQCQKLIFILFYFRVYPTQDVLGLFFSLSQPQVCDWVHRLTPLLQSALGRELHLPTRPPARLHQVLPAAQTWRSFSTGRNAPCGVRRPNPPSANTPAGGAKPTP